jgi:hypothetical protein
MRRAARAWRRKICWRLTAFTKYIDELNSDYEKGPVAACQ